MICVRGLVEAWPVTADVCTGLVCTTDIILPRLEICRHRRETQIHESPENIGYYGEVSRMLDHQTCGSRIILALTDRQSCRSLTSCSLSFPIVTVGQLLHPPYWFKKTPPLSDQSIQRCRVRGSILQNPWFKAPKGALK